MFTRGLTRRSTCLWYINIDSGHTHSDTISKFHLRHRNSAHLPRS